MNEIRSDPKLATLCQLDLQFWATDWDVPPIESAGAAQFVGNGGDNIYEPLPI